nr:methyltransferase domain-containing protein [Actinomadura darangshiensis]
MWTDAALRAFWERELCFPEHYFSHKHGARLTRALRPHISGGDEVLDYGCGRGHLSERICRDLGAEVWATDSLQGALEATNRLNASNPGFRGAVPIEEFRSAADRFDSIVAVEVLEHLADDALRAFFDTAARLLRISGRLIVTTPNRERLASKEVLCPSCGIVFHRWQHVRSIDTEQLRAWGAAVGLELSQALETDFSGTRPRFGGGLFRRRPPGRPHLMGVFVRSGES